MRKTHIEMTFPYILGLLETDGSFHILFKKDPRMPLKYRIQPEVQWSQKNVNLLRSVQRFLLQMGIRSKFKNDPGNAKTSRAPVLKIEGIAECQRFLLSIKEWAESSRCPPLYGCKYVDYLLMQGLYSIIESGAHNTLTGRQQVLDLKFHLHLPPRALNTLQHPLFSGKKGKTGIVQGGQLSREIWEERQGVPNSRGKGWIFIDRVHKEYMAFAKELLKNPKKLHSDFFSGVLEGDGYIYAKSNKPPRFSIVAERGSELLLFAISSTLGDCKPCFYDRGSYTIYMAARVELLLNLHTHLQKHPILFKETGLLEFTRWGKGKVTVYNV